MISKRIKTIVLTLTATMIMGALSSVSFAETVQTTSLASTTTAISDFYYSGKNATLDLQFDNVISNLRNYKAKHPKATNKALNDYAKSLLQNTSNTANNLSSEQMMATASSDLDGYISGYLNSQEQALYNSNPFNGLLCMGDGKLAITYAQSNYQNTEAVQHNGNGDAFRHTLWNYGMSQDVGTSFAKQWSDAHEYGTPNNPPLERQMDLFNNGCGIYLYNLNGFSTVSTMISKTKDMVSRGGCEIIRNNTIVNSDSVGKL